jgi:TIR domain
MSTVFISYRREETSGEARALFNDLVKMLDERSVFMDVDSIALGRDFRQALQERLASCDLMLVLIGKSWADAKDEAGHRRLEDPNDFVRVEISAALKRSIPVTPILVQGARVPAAERLPDDIKDLAFRNGFELSHSRWESDVREMVRRLELGPTTPAVVDPKGTTPPTAPQPEGAGIGGGIAIQSQSARHRWTVILAGALLLFATAGGGLLYLRNMHDGVVPPPPASAGAAPVTPEIQQVNLLAPDNGGHLFAATSDEWLRVLDGRDHIIVLDGHKPEEAVFAFKDGRSATFDTFKVLVPQTDMNNLKDFELQVGDSPDGAFKPIGKFQARNTKLFNNPYQDFRFPPVTSRYLKVTLLSNHNGYDYPFEVYGFQLLGKLEEK